MSFFALELPHLFFPMVALVKHRGYTLVAMSLLPVRRDTLGFYFHFLFVYFLFIYFLFFIFSFIFVYLFIIFYFFSFLVYGSHDGGATVHKSNPAFSEIMEQAGKLLNLREHICGVGGGKKKVEKLWVAADIEGHVGVDDNRYLLDFGRAMPPVTPNKNFYNGHIYQLFRREFVAGFKKSLCSDAYSGFVIQDPLLKEYNRDVDEATQYLFSTVIPKCGKGLLERGRGGRGGGGEGYWGGGGQQVRVVEILHQHGVNLRYLGRIINTYRSQKLLVAMYGRGGVERVTNMLLVEAVARVIKNQMNAKMREIGREVREPVEVIYRERSVSLLNLVFGESEASRRWWVGVLTEDLLDHFSVGRYIVVSSDKNGEEYSSIRNKFWDWGEGWGEGGVEEGGGGGGEGDKFFDWEGEGGGEGGRGGREEGRERGGGRRKGWGRYALFERVVGLCGLRVTEDTWRKMRDGGLIHVPEPLDLLDVVELGDRVKHMEIVSRTKGVFFQLRAAKEADVGVAVSLLTQSVGHFNGALLSMPTNREVLFQCGVSWYRLLELHSLSSSPSTSTSSLASLPSSSPSLTPTLSSQKHLSLPPATDSAPLPLTALSPSSEGGRDNPFSSKDPQGTFFDVSNPLTQEAEELYRRLLMVDKENPSSLALCGKFFASCHRFEVAEECFLAALEADPHCHFARLCYGVFLYLYSNQTTGLKVLSSVGGDGEGGWGWGGGGWGGGGRGGGANGGFRGGERGGRLGYLLGREWAVRIDVYMADGSFMSAGVHVNVTARGLVGLLSRKKVQKDAVIVEVCLNGGKGESKGESKGMRFRDLVVGKRGSVRVLGEGELPWVVGKGRGVMLYYVSRRYLNVSEK